jgi:hypothetical protein
MILQGSAKLVASAAANSVTSHLFYTNHLFSPDKDEAVAHFYNSETKQSKLTILSADWGIWRSATVGKAMHGTGFQFILMNEHDFDLILTDLEGTIKWRKTIECGKNSGIKSFSTDEVLFVFITDKMYSKRQSSHLLKINLYNGEIISRIELANKKSESMIDYIFDSKRNMILAGRKMLSGTINNKRPEAPEFHRLSPSATAPKELLYSPELFGLPIAWMGTITANSEEYLIGETFNSGSSGEYLAKGIASAFLTGGLLAVTWNSMQFNDLVIFKLPNDSVNNDKPKVKIFPLIPRRINIGRYLDPYTFVKYSIETGRTHYMGKLGTKVFLLDGSQLKSYDISFETFTNIGQVEVDFENILYTTEHITIVLNNIKSRHTTEIKLKKW